MMKRKTAVVKCTVELSGRVEGTLQSYDSKYC